MFNLKVALLKWLTSAKIDKNMNITGGHPVVCGVDTVKCNSESDSLDSRGMHFKLLPGLGGMAIETSYYDERKDNRITKLYILPDGCELGEELARIISLESLNMR